MNDNKLDLTLVDKLFLLALDDEKGTFVSNSLVYGYCVAGAVLFELTIKERIQIEENKIKVINKEELNDVVLDYCLQLICSSKRDKKVRSWIETFGMKIGEIRKKELNKLMSLEILKERENKILLVFTNKNYPTKNEMPENNLRKRLKDVILNKSKAKEDEVMLISLIDSCELNKEVYGKEIVKMKNKEIKRLIKNYTFENNTDILIKELNETIIGVVASIVITTVISS